MGRIFRTEEQLAQRIYQKVCSCKNNDLTDYVLRINLFKLHNKGFLEIMPNGDCKQNFLPHHLRENFVSSTPMVVMLPGVASVCG